MKMSGQRIVSFGFRYTRNHDMVRRRCRAQSDPQRGMTERQKTISPVEIAGKPTSRVIGDSGCARLRQEPPRLHEFPRGFTRSEWRANWTYISVGAL